MSNRIKIKLDLVEYIQLSLARERKSQIPDYTIESIIDAVRFFDSMHKEQQPLEVKPLVESPKDVEVMAKTLPPPLEIRFHSKLADGTVIYKTKAGNECCLPRGADKMIALPAANFMAAAVGTPLPILTNYIIVADF